MKSLSHRVVLLVCLLGLLTAFGPAFGRVFWKRSVSGLAALDALSGQRMVYRTDVLINGHPGALHVVACDDNALTAAERLRGAWHGDTLSFRHGAGVSVGVAGNASRVSRFLLLEIPNAATTLAFVLEQSEADYRASLAAPDVVGLAGWPLYPGSLPQVRLENTTRGVGMAVMTVGASVATAAGFYQQELAARGFRSLLPELSDGQDQCFLLYGKGQALCCVLAGEDSDPVCSTVVLLCKNLEID
ncbi:MAG: hypothetical protein ACOYCD_03725 [Kiritimatiellia bacterium]